MTACRGCAESDLKRVLDLGKRACGRPLPACNGSCARGRGIACVGHGRVPCLRPGSTGRRRHGHRRAAWRGAAGTEGPGRSRNRTGRSGGLAAGRHRPRIRQPARRHVDPATRRAWVHYRDVPGGCGAGLFRHHARTRPAERLRAARPGHRPGRRATAAVSLDRQRSSSKVSGMRCGTAISLTTR